MHDSDSELLRLRERCFAEPLVMRFLKEIIDELQAEVDREKQKEKEKEKRSPAASA